MSGPTKGMVAGQPIKTGAQTKEWDENHARIFGERKPVRGSWVWDEAAQRMVDASSYRPPTRAEGLQISTDRHYENTATLDGHDIGSRRKREEYMRVNGLADPRDFRGTLADAERKRARESEYKGATPERVREVADIIGRKAYELSKQKRRR